MSVHGLLCVHDVSVHGLLCVFGMSVHGLLCVPDVSVSLSVYVFACELIPLDVGWEGAQVKGGSGAIWQHVYEHCDQSKFRFNCKVQHIKTKEKKVVLESGEEIEYDYLFSPIPADIFAQMSVPFSLSLSLFLPSFMQSKSWLPPSWKCEQCAGPTTVG